MHEPNGNWPEGNGGAARGGGVAGWLALGLVVVAVLVLLVFPADSGAVPAWLPLLQARVKGGMVFLAPYLIVALLGGAVGTAELASTFQTYPREALSTRWARILILVNGVAAVLALVVARITMPETNLVWLVIVVGIGFQSLIRTRFVLAKQIGGDGTGESEVSVNLGWLYDQFQNLCRTQIDLELMNKRRTAVTRLLEYYPTLAELYDIAWYTIIARATLTPEQEKARLEQLEKLIDPKAPENFARASIALMILENGGPPYVNLLLHQAMGPESVSPAQANTPEALVRLLCERYSLAELVNLTEQLTEVSEIREWVRNAARPSPEVREANQKTAIAYFLVQEVGLDAVRRAVGD
ncbi:MAG: hypothetical protein D6706_02245 [Chloroflexi bacterium]|nr:MAG: hypothetical protein D6706_02245 [Chloroflexota bacterium]